MKFIRPISEKKVKELEKELEIQKKRLFDAAEETVESVRKEFSLESLIRAYPLHSGAFLFFGGLMMTQLALAKSKKAGLTKSLSSETHPHSGPALSRS